jgi:hypothetical protein
MSTRTPNSTYTSSLAVRLQKYTNEKSARTFIRYRDNSVRSLLWITQQQTYRRFTPYCTNSMPVHINLNLITQQIHYEAKQETEPNTYVCISPSAHKIAKDGLMTTFPALLVYVQKIALTTKFHSANLQLFYN